MKELKPCPFCGYEIKDYTLEYRDGKLEGLTAHCWMCQARFELFNEYDPDAPDAIDRWNRRADDGL